MILGTHIFDADGFNSLLHLLSYRAKWFNAPVRLGCLEAMGWIRDQLTPFTSEGGPGPLPIMGTMRGTSRQVTMIIPPHRHWANSQPGYRWFWT